MSSKIRRTSFGSRFFAAEMQAEDKREGVKLGTWITGIMFFGENPGYDTFKTILEERLLSMSRFRSTSDLKYKRGAFHELDLAEIDWNYHLCIPEFAETEVTEERMLEFSGSIVCDNSIDLDVTKPLWRFFMFPSVRTSSGEIKTVLIALTSHAIADGISLLGVLFKISDDSPIDPFQPIKLQKDKHITGKKKKKAKLGLLARTSVFLGGIHGALFGSSAAFDPKTSLSLADPSSHGKKLCGSAEEIPLPEIKRLKNKFSQYGVTVNDIILTVMSMTLRAYYEETGELTSKLKIRSNFLVSLHSPKEPLLPNGDPRNKFGLHLFKHVFDYKSPIDCLFQVKRQTDRAKLSPEVLLAYKMSSALMKVVPKKILVPLSYKIVDRAASLISNVPGPQQPLKVAGCDIEKLSFHAHCRAAVYLGLLSYNDKVNLSLTVDERLGISPQKLLKHWNAQYKVLATEIDDVAKRLQQGDSIPRTENERKNLKSKMRTFDLH